MKPKFVPRVITLVFTLIFCSAIQAQTFGPSASSVWITDCLQDNYFNTTGTIGPVGNVFTNTDFGTHTRNSGTLILRGGEVRTFKTPGVANVCSVKMYYRIYPQSGVPGAFTSIDLPLVDNCDIPTSQFPSGGSCVDGDQKWKLIIPDGASSPSPVDLTAFAPGNYVLEVYYDVTGSSTSTSLCNETSTLNNGGANYKATFSIQAPLLFSANPTTCGGSEGYIQISGLTPGATYLIGYSKNGNAVAPANMVADGSGVVTISNLSKGLYSDFLLTINGCSTFLNTGIVLSDPIFTPKFNKINPFCAGSPAPTLPTTSLNGITGTWNPAVVDNMNSGTYTFTPNSGQCGLNYTMNITVIQKTTPTFTFGTSLTICAGGAVPALPTTSTNGYTGTWSPAVVDNQNSGTYTFTINPGQCATNATFTVTVTPNKTPTFAIGTTLTICAGAGVPALPTTSSNGVTGTWSPSTIDNQNSGTYTFTPSAGQCATTASFSVTVNPNVTPTFSFGSSTICSGSAVPILPNTSNNGITGTWNPATVSNTSSGTYTFTPTAGACAVPFSFTVTVTSNITPTFAFGNSMTICSGAAVPALPNTSNNSITGTWSPSSIDNTTSGTYTFTPDPGQCALTATLTVTVNPNVTPTFSFGTALAACAGASVPTLPTTSSNGITGTWSPSTVDNTTSGTYTFTPTAGQCATTTTLDVTINPNTVPTFAFGNSLTICAGSAVPTLPTTSNNGVNGTWSPATVSNTNSGTYTFTPTAGQCATTATFTVTVTPNATPTFAFGTSMTICNGAAVPTLPTTSNNGVTGTWSPSTVDNTTSGTYTFTPDAGQCALTATFTVTVNPILTPTFSFGTSMTICTGATVPALPTTSTNGVTGTWSPSAIDNQNSATYTFTPTAGQCATGTTLDVTVNPATITPTFSFGTSATICQGTAVPTLVTTSTNGITGTWSPASVDNQNSGTYTFTPTPGQCALPTTFDVTVNPSIFPTFSFGTTLTICAGSAVPSLPTTSNNGYTGTWSPATVSNQNSAVYTFTPDPVAGQCLVNTTFTVTVNQILTPTFNFGTAFNVCSGTTPPALPTTSNNGITGVWNPTTIDNQNSASYTFTTNAGQCADPSATIAVTIVQTPTVSVESDTTVVDGTIMPTNVLNGSPAGVNYNWTNSNTGIGLSASGSGNVPSFTATNKGNSNIKGTITITPVFNGCSGATVNYVVTVIPLDKDVFVPNVFTPNGDGKNDMLYAYGNYIAKLDMHIFNQWGQEIAVINDVHQGWDGKYKGTPQPVGVYVYTVKAVMTDGRVIQLKGNITLLR